MRLFLVLSIVILSSTLISFPSFAQVQGPSGSLQTEVSATVGELTLSVSGFAAPNASIVLAELDGRVIQSAVADSNGKFSFSLLPIKRGFLGFCLTVVDLKRLGELVTCFQLAPAQESIVMTDIFLPPTLGVSRKVITAGSEVVAFGYTRPRARVRLRLSTGQNLTTLADERGYYEFRTEKLKAGKYNLTATATFQEKQSLEPTKALEIEVVSKPEETRRQAVGLLRNLWDETGKLFTSLALGPLLLAIPLFLVILFLVGKLFSQSRARKKNGKLHHEWFMGW